MPPELILAYFDPQDFPADFARLLREDGFRLASGPYGTAVRPADPDRGPARSLFLEAPPGPRGQGAFRALYARARTGVPTAAPELLRRMWERAGGRP
ncbi:MAG TPA: hypothetical protein VNO22_07880 [Planctomycetota bacterium]|nr:hypothetical protein [Planctomycetota bacterium]